MIENIELQELIASATDGKAILSKRDMSLCGHVNASADVVVCSFEISISELFSLKVGDVVKSKESVDAPMTLILDGKRIARGNLVAIEDRFGFEVTDIGE
jgi:flagellar motor switch protein FliN